MGLLLYEVVEENQVLRSEVPHSGVLVQVYEYVLHEGLHSAHSELSLFLVDVLGILKRVVVKTSLDVPHDFLQHFLYGVHCPHGSGFSVKLEVLSEFLKVGVSVETLSHSDSSKELQEDKNHSEPLLELESPSVRRLHFGRSSDVLNGLIFVVSLL